jgi:DNA-directed RNA polymerase I, II, and III subunit RPABC1
MTLIANVENIIRLRGYTILDTEYPGPFAGETSILCDKCIIIFSKNNKININSIKTCIQFVDGLDKQVQNVILVYNGTITSTVSKIIEMCHHQHYELFTERELFVDITSHHLVPKHEKVTDLKAEFTPMQMMEFKNFPKILRTDPISKYYNFQPGDIIRITRRNGVVLYRQTI